jgi:membrane-bound lytic murein transglycosylase D
MLRRCYFPPSGTLFNGLFPMNRLNMRIWLLSALVMGLSACGGTKTTVIPTESWAASPRPKPQPAPLQKRPKPATYSGIFLKPGELEPAVEFWRNVYVKWQRSEVVFHDNRQLDVIYEVMALPGYVGDSLTPEQKEIVNQRRNFWKTQLAVLESKQRYNAPLDAGDRQLIARLESSGKPLASLLDGAAERVHAQRGTRERFKRGLEISARYERQFRKIFRDAGLPEDLAYLPHVESSFQPSARSSAGAVGMWQFTKAAAKRFMPAAGKRRVDRRLDPFASAVGAANYLSHAYSTLGNWPAAITSYNHGIGGMKRAQNQMGSDFARIVQSYAGPSFGFASRNYYAQFLAAREIASNPLQYFPEEGMYAKTQGNRNLDGGDSPLSPLSEAALER